MATPGHLGYIFVEKFLRLILWPLREPLLWAWRLFVAVLKRVMANGGTGTASQFAYNTFLATVPFLFAVVTLLSASSDESFDKLFNALEGTIPGITGLTDTVNESTLTGTAAGFLIAIGVLVGLYMASNAIGALVDGLNRAQRLNHRPWVRGKIINYAFAAAASVLAVAGTVALAGGARLVRGLADLLGAGQGIRDLADRLTLPVGFAVLFLFTLLIYRLGPNGLRLSVRTLIPGVALSVFATFGLSKLIALYADAFNNLDAVYGTLGSLFVYLTFLYFTGLMFLAGAELNAELIHRRLVRAAARDAEAREEAERQGPPTPDEAATISTPLPGPPTVRFPDAGSSS